ncbi:MAG TPA: SagB/ThcOx family dehydrogenase [Spirochaetota bacterium]|nr:SagB/ThcOx family dehydrogenase [Spirochaetota bacterium]HRZ26857.1 SagB/ThcOx family dehydrogenase [Spirochaetota bacterium]HSA15153.1 SagB/ThcOx family dehydrogenase [Spirochaetota bacterium]
MKKSLILLSIISLFVVSSPDRAVSEARKLIMLPKPAMTGGMPLMTALAKRQSSRSFSEKPLPDQVLSNLLWAADGVNRPDSGKRTAPSAMNKQEIDIYVALAEGLYRYDAAKHALELVLDRDIRAQTGQQDFVAGAALNLVYVADLSAAAGSDREEKVMYAAADTGFIGQNVYLFCASEGLATVIRGYIDRKALGKAMKLKSGQMIILAQTVGYPGK